MERFRAFARTVKRLRHTNSGAALIEFAVVLPVMTLLALGVADYGRVYFTAIKVANAAEAGAQYGARDDAHSGQTAAIIAAARNDADDQTLAVTPRQFCECPTGTAWPNCTQVCNSYSDGIPESYVEVTASQTVNLLIHYPGIPPSIFVSRKVTLRVQ